MELLRRNILFKGRVLGEMVYLGYTVEESGMVARFLLLKAYGIRMRPLSDVIGPGKMFEVEIVANEKEKSFEEIFIAKYSLSERDSTLASTTPTAVKYPKAFLSSVVRKMQKEMVRLWGKAPVEDPAF